MKHSIAALLMMAGCGVPSLSAAEMAFVAKGQIEAAHAIEGKWERGEGHLVSTGKHYLYAARGLGAGDFRVQALLSLDRLAGTAAAFVMDGNQFGFEGQHGKMFVQGPQFGKSRPIADPKDFIQPGKPFDLEVRRQGKTLTFLIDGQQVWATDYAPNDVRAFGLRPWRATMRIYEFSAEGRLIEASVPAQPVQSKELAVPTIDISGETDRHVIVAAGTETDYRGQVNTVLMGDGKTMFAVWSIGHGGKCGPMKKSVDGGLTWSDMIPTPENWGEVGSCPCIFRLTDAKGVERLFVFAGRGKHHRSMSLDDGKTWTPMEETGLFKPGGNTTIIPIDKGRRHLLLMQRGPVNAPQNEKTQAVWQAVSSDGGLSWTDYRKVCEVPGAVPCEPDLVRSPDGRQIACLMRENARRLNSLVMFSDNEGENWSQARELPASLTGDRHMSCYAPDGRLVVVFRDRATGGPTYGHYVVWIGTYDDIRHGRPGQYRVKLLHSHAGPDCGYSGLERLPDGTMVATTYIKYRPGPEKHSIVSVRFKLDEIDAAFQRMVLGASADQLKELEAGRKAGLIELAPVNLPTKPKGDNDHFGWPVATMIDDTIIVVHREMCGHNRRLSGTPDEFTTYSAILRSDDGGSTWSKSYDVRKCMSPEARRIDGLVPLSHRYKFQPDNLRLEGYKVHLNGIGTTHDGSVVLVCNHGVFRSDDKGRTWRHFAQAFRHDNHSPDAVFFSSGPHLIDLGRGRGLYAFGHHTTRGPADPEKRRTARTSPTTPRDILQEMAMYRSDDGGQSWKNVTIPIPDGCKPAEPDVMFHEGEFVAIVRNQTPANILAQMRWKPGDKTIEDVANTNMRTNRSVDTSAICFNPVTDRFEVVQSKREDMTINLFSIALEDWDTAQWRFEGQLFQRGGSFYSTADGFHTGGSVIDRERSVQHVFFYSGHPGGPAGVFRLTRTLDTPRLAEFLKQQGNRHRRSTVRWTGDAKSASWNDPGNWDIGMPDKHDVVICGFDDDDFFCFRADPFKSCDKGKEFRIDAVKFVGWPDDGKAGVEQRGEYWYLKPMTACLSEGLP